MRLRRRRHGVGFIGRSPRRARAATRRNSSASAARRLSVASNAPPGDRWRSAACPPATAECPRVAPLRVLEEVLRYVCKRCAAAQQQQGRYSPRVLLPPIGESRKVRECRASPVAASARVRWRGGVLPLPRQVPRTPLAPAAHPAHGTAVVQSCRRHGSAVACRSMLVRYNVEGRQ